MKKFIILSAVILLSLESQLCAVCPSVNVENIPEIGQTREFRKDGKLWCSSQSLHIDGKILFVSHSQETAEETKTCPYTVAYQRGGKTLTTRFYLRDGGDPSGSCAGIRKALEKNEKETS